MRVGHPVVMGAVLLGRVRAVHAHSAVVQLVNKIILDAHVRGGSDIHIEPFENRLVVRFRVDGVLRRRTDLIGRAPVVLFWVEDIEMVRGEPSSRRGSPHPQLGSGSVPLTNTH